MPSTPFDRRDHLRKVAGRRIQVTNPKTMGFGPRPDHYLEANFACTLSYDQPTKSAIRNWHRDIAQPAEQHKTPLPFLPRRGRWMMVIT